VNRTQSEPTGRGPAAEDGTHLCPARGCPLRVPRNKLVCLTHWQMIPRTLRNELWRAWDSGRGVGTEAYTLAALAAIKAVNARIEEQNREHR
jgi:hypothetical protein